MWLFGWNDYVEVDKAAPEQYRPGSRGSVIGFDPIISDEGIELWTIELDEANGPDIQVPAKYIHVIKKSDPKIEEYSVSNKGK